MSMKGSTFFWQNQANQVFFPYCVQQTSSDSVKMQLKEDKAVKSAVSWFHILKCWFQQSGKKRVRWACQIIAILIPVREKPVYK